MESTPSSVIHDSWSICFGVNFNVAAITKLHSITDFLETVIN